MDNKEKALLCHKQWNGKLETIAKSKVNSREDLAIAYTPGVAEPCKVIAEDKSAAYTLSLIHIFRILRKKQNLQFILKFCKTRLGFIQFFLCKLTHLFIGFFAQHSK